MQYEGKVDKQVHRKVEVQMKEDEDKVPVGCFVML